MTHNQTKSSHMQSRVSVTKSCKNLGRNVYKIQNFLLHKTAHSASSLQKVGDMLCIAAAAPPTFRPGNPALCGSHPL